MFTLKRNTDTPANAAIYEFVKRRIDLYIYTFVTVKDNIKRTRGANPLCHSILFHMNKIIRV